MNTKAEKKTCFVIMPISDQSDYDKGHFTRVYEHLIKPACENAGFRAIRADEEAKTNYIVIDIIRKILESDIVLCDLSAKNPNVLYELGLRQAFNKKAVLIKDNKTDRIFDIQGLRTIDYDCTLRIDDVKNKIGIISKTLQETYKSGEDNVNSLIQLLSIKPASLGERVELSKDSSLILEAINNISDRISNLESNYEYRRFISSNINKLRRTNLTFPDKSKASLGDEIFDEKRNVLGTLTGVFTDKIYIDTGSTIIEILKDSSTFKNLSGYPF